MSLDWPGSALPHLSLSMNFAAIGPRHMPMMTAGTIPFLDVSLFFFPLSLGGFVVGLGGSERTRFTQVP